MTGTEIATVNLDMLDRAGKSEGQSSSVMDSIHTLKVYNPQIGKPAEAEKAGKFSIREANTGKEELSEGPFTFNVLDVSFFYSGSIYPILPSGAFAEEKVFFFTNEFSKFAKKTDTVGLAAGRSPVGFFQKGDFENVIKAPQLNGMENQFYERKKDKDGRPYNSSQLSRSAMIYGQFIDGPYAGDFFRFRTSMSNIGTTFRDGEVVPAAEGTFEAAMDKALVRMNKILVANGRREISRVSPDQVDLKIHIEENERGNFLPKFEFAGLVAERGIDNIDSVQYVKDLKAEHFSSIFGTMLEPAPVMIDGNNAEVKIAQVEAPKSKALAQPELAPEDDIFADNDAFGPPAGSLAKHEKEKNALEF